MNAKVINCLLCIGCVLTSAVLAQSPVTVTIDTQARGWAIPADYAGLSFESWVEGPNRGGVSGHLFSPTNTQFLTLFTNSSIRHLRLGGSTVDGLHAYFPSHDDIDSVFGFARAAHIKVIYSLPLLDGDAAKSAAAAQYIWAHYRPWLDCFAIGNEPNEPPYLKAPVGALTNYDAFLAAWSTFACAITHAVPEARFTGPEAGGYDWVVRFAQDTKSLGRVVLITEHEYAGGRPFINRGRDEMPPAVAISNMLSRDWLTNEYLHFYEKTLKPVSAEGLLCRQTEANDYLRGVTNASDAFGSALWALDYMHWWAARGLAGIDFHNNEWLKTDTIYLDRASSTYRLNPKAYAFKAFELGRAGCVEPTGIGNTEGLNLTAYAVGDATHLYVTLINKEHGPGARDAAVTLVPRGFSARSGQVMFLTAPQDDPGATRGITLGGAAISDNTPWRGQWTALHSIANGSWPVVVPHTSAAVVEILLTAEDPKCTKPQPWPGGIIPYDISKLTPAQQTNALKAMQRWMDTGANIRFIPRTHEPEYVNFTGNTNAGNNTSRVGFKQGVRTDINITAFWWRQQEWMPAHELGHVLGFFHEHQRWDRDQYLTVHYEHIKPGRAGDYDWIARTNWLVTTLPYDFHSIMHYRVCWASQCEDQCKDGVGSSPCAVLEPKDKAFDGVIGQWTANGISALDAEKARQVYGIRASTPAPLVPSH